MNSPFEERMVGLSARIHIAAVEENTTLNVNARGADPTPIAARRVSSDTADTICFFIRVVHTDMDQLSRLPFQNALDTVLVYWSSYWLSPPLRTKI